MAVVDRSATAISNRDAKPAVLNNPVVQRQNMKNVIGSYSPANGDSIASIYRLLSVPTNARIAQLLLSCSAITTCAGDIGVYRPTTLAGVAGAVIDADFFASAQSLAAALSQTNVINESTVNTIAKQEQPLWQALGETSDPGGFYDIAVTLTAAAGSAGDIQLQASYSE